jgi:hypothetical protein
MTTIMRLLRRFRAYLFPLKGWKARLSDFRRGNTVWPIAGHPELPASCPWPIEWTPYEIVEEEGKSTVKFIAVYSAVSGVLAEGDHAVACCRCGIHLHVAETTMRTNLDVPYCSWCAGKVEPSL